MTNFVICSIALLFHCSTFAFQHQSLSGSTYCHKNDDIVKNHNRNSRLCMSVPNGIDTLASGLASIVRVNENGLAGVTVVAKTENEACRLLQLYDVENSNSCRMVRELITELDLVVDQVIPSASNSRNNVAEVPTLALSMDGEEQTISGASNIVNFLKTTYGLMDQPKDDSQQQSWQQVINALSPVGMFLASTLRAGRGNAVSPAAAAAAKPEKSLILYSYEGNQFCRLVREVLTELDIVYELRSAGKGSPRRSELAERTGGSSQCPYLVDPNTGTEMAESADIIRYLYDTYASWTPPNELLEWVSQSVMPVFKPVFSYLTPLQAGSSSEDNVYESNLQQSLQDIRTETSSHPVVIYTYELSPFSSETKSLLDALQVDYKEISLGKEWIPGLLSDATKRAALLQMTGQSSLPHVFIDGTSIGGLFSGNPGVLPLLKDNKFQSMIEEATAKSKKE